MDEDQDGLNDRRRSGPWDTPQIDAAAENRRLLVEKAEKLPPLDAAWIVVHYNEYVRTHRAGNELEPIRFDELRKEWSEAEIREATERALALHQDAYRIGDWAHALKGKAWQKARADFAALHYGFSDDTIDAVILYGHVLAR